MKDHCEDWRLPWQSSIKISPSNAGGVGLIPGQGAKILYDLWPKKSKHKQQKYYNKSNKDFLKWSTLTNLKKKKRLLWGLNTLTNIKYFHEYVLNPTYVLTLTISEICYFDIYFKDMFIILHCFITMFKLHPAKKHF